MGRSYLDLIYIFVHFSKSIAFFFYKFMFIFRIGMHKKLMVVILIGIVIGRTAGSQEN